MQNKQYKDNNNNKNIEIIENDEYNIKPSSSSTDTKDKEDFNNDNETSNLILTTNNINKNYETFTQSTIIADLNNSLEDNKLKQEDDLADIDRAQSQIEEIKQKDLINKLFSNLQSFFNRMFHYMFDCLNNYEFVKFSMITLIIYIHTQSIIFCIDDISTKLNLSSALLGLTVLTWAGNIGDVMNACFLVKETLIDLMMSSMIVSQIINLQISLVYPWLVSVLVGVRKNVSFKHPLTINFFKEALASISISVLIIVASQFKMKKSVGVLLLFVYILSIIYEFKKHLF